MTNIRTIRKYAVALIAASAGVGMFISEFHRIRALPSSILNYGYLGCFLLVASLVFGWIWVSENEIGLDVWLYPKKKRIPAGTKETAQILLLALTLVALFYAARDPLLLSAAFTVYSSLVCLAVFRMNTVYLPPLLADSRDHIRENPEKWSNTITDLRLEALSTLEAYFIQRPHTPRHVLILDGAFCAFAISLYAHLKARADWGLAAYACIFILILVSEIIIFSWRINRDNILKQIDESLREAGHDIEKY